MEEYTDRNANGTFRKGNQAARRNPEYKSIRQATKGELLRSVYNLSKPMKDIKEIANSEDTSGYDWMVAHAVVNEKFSYVQWAIEMAIGKPKQITMLENDGAEIQIVYKVTEKPDDNSDITPSA